MPIVDTFDFSLKKNKEVKEIFGKIKHYMDIERKCMDDTLDYKFIIKKADDIFAEKIKAVKSGKTYKFTNIALFKHQNATTMQWMTYDIQELIKKIITKEYSQDKVFGAFYKNHKYIFDDLFKKDAVFKVSNLDTLPLFVTLFLKTFVVAKFLAEGDDNMGFYCLIGIKNPKKQKIYIDDIFEYV